MQNAATRSPGRRPLDSGASRTTPPTSLPGTNGSSGLSWYSPRVCSSSGYDTPAAWTSTTTPAPGVIGWDGPGSGSSAGRSAPAGPLSSAIWRAFMAGYDAAVAAAPTLPLRHGRTLTLDAAGEEDLVEVRDAAGALELRIRLTEDGPVLQ